MEVQLRLADVENGHADLMSLRDWLVREPEYRGRVGVEQPEPEPGHMGAMVEVLTVALAGGGAVSALMGSVSVWLEQRRSNITVEIVDADGGSTKVTARGRAADTVAKNLDPDRETS